MTRRWLGPLAGVLVCLAVTHAAAQTPRRLAPVDEGGSDPSFGAFRLALRDIIRKRDLPGLLGVLSAEVRSSASGETGIKEFQAMWNTASPDSALWPTLERLLALGGTFASQDGVYEFHAPYVFSRWPDDLDPREYVAITAPRVLVRVPGPRQGAVLAAVSYALVRRADGAGDPKPGAQYPVVLGDGRAGVVDGAFVRSPLDYRAAFRKTPGGWRLIHLLAGD